MGTEPLEARKRELRAAARRVPMEPFGAAATAAQRRILALPELRGAATVLLYAAAASTPSPAPPTPSSMSTPLSGLAVAMAAERSPAPMSRILAYGAAFLVRDDRNGRASQPDIIEHSRHLCVMVEIGVK